MKKALIILTFVFCLSTALSAQPPLEYTVARTDANRTPGFPIVPGNVWSTGMGTKWCFPNDQDHYNGICIWRLTDASVFPGGPAVQIPDNDAENATVQTTPNQKDNIISAPNGSVRYIIVGSTSGAPSIIAFDKTNNTATTVASRPKGEMMFDETNPGIIYARVNHTQIKKYTSTDGWQSYTSSDIYDFANCLPQGYQAKWQGSWATAVPTNTSTGTYHTWGTAFSDVANQGTGYWVLAYREALHGAGAGCASIDTLHGQAYGWNGQPLGPLDDGNGNPLPSFTIHDGGLTRNPGFFDIAPAASCQTCAPSIWEIGTTHVRPCTNQCHGHSAEGFYDRACHKGNNSFMLLHPFGDPNNNLIGPLLTDYPPSGYDEHASWLNIPANETGGVDIYPIIITTSLVTDQLIQQYSLWGEDEIIGVSANPDDYGLNVHWRFGQTGNSGMSPYYTCQNAKGTVAELGDGIAFTSDMASDGSGSPLGIDSNGNPRCDVFWMELK